MEYVPLITLIVINILDLISTRTFLILGYREGNPIGEFLLRRFGFKGLVYLKIFISAFVIIIGLSTPIFLKLIPILNLTLSCALIYSLLIVLKGVKIKTR